MLIGSPDVRCVLCHQTSTGLEDHVHVVRNMALIEVALALESFTDKMGETLQGERSFL